MLVVESGDWTETPFAAGLSEAEIPCPAQHAPMRIATRRAVGGTSAWWGGRCVPFDPIDFSERPWIPGAGWPIRYEDVQPWFEPATAYFGCGPATYRAGNAPWPLKRAGFQDLERWAPVPDMARRHRARLDALGVRIMSCTTVTGIIPSPCGSRIASLTAVQPAGEVALEAKHFVLACGGLETTRLLLNVQTAHPHLFGGPEGPLGRSYAGHQSGKIADLVFENAQDVRHTDFFRDGSVFARRRFTLTPETQAAEQLLNIAFWTDNPPFHNPDHGNGALSLVWTVLAMPFIGRRLLSDGVRLSHLGPKPHRIGAHLLNILRRPDRLVGDVFAILRTRLFSNPRQPGFLLHSRAGRYALHFHAEQSPNPDSRVRLSQTKDAVGMARLRIEMRFSEADAHRIVRSHDILDRALQAAGVGRLVFKSPPEDLIASVMAQAADGFHQTGTTRMSASPIDGVVDAECRVHGLENLYIASSSVFPTSGQANPTLLTVALGLRLAARLSQPSVGKVHENG